MAQNQVTLNSQPLQQHHHHHHHHRHCRCSCHQHRHHHVYSNPHHCPHHHHPGAAHGGYYPAPSISPAPPFFYPLTLPLTFPPIAPPHDHTQNPSSFSGYPANLYSGSVVGEPDAQEVEEAEDDDDDEDPIFVLTDEWKEFFAKSEARRKEAKKQARQQGK